MAELGGGGGGGGGEGNNNSKQEKEGKNLLGLPSFVKLDNGRFKCVETGHELPAHAKDSYAQTKHCRLGLIDAALSNKTPPLNMFRQHPLHRSKLICKLSGDTVNKSEVHIWKHINGKRFLNMLGKKETEHETQNEKVEQESKQTLEKKSNTKSDKLKKKKKKQEQNGSKLMLEVKGASDEVGDVEEADFWMPSVGERWGFDNGGDRFGSGTETATETDDAEREDILMSLDGVAKEAENHAGELSKQTKRMSTEIGSRSFASRKKKKKTKSN